MYEPLNQGLYFQKQMAQLLHLSVCEMYLFSLEVTKVKCQYVEALMVLPTPAMQYSEPEEATWIGNVLFKAKLVASERQTLSATAQIVHIIISGSPRIPYYPNHVINYVMKASAAPTF